MTDLLAALALRGAGLAAADDRGALAPRPRALFEPDASGSPADATLTERVEEVAASEGTVAAIVVPARTPAAPRRPPPAPPRDHSSLHDGTPSPATVSAPPVASPRGRPTASDASSAPVAPVPAAVRQPAVPAPPIRTASSTAAAASGAAPRPATPRDTPAAPTTAAPPTTDGSEHAESRIAVTGRPPPAPAAATVRIPEAPAESRPAVTVSIGRIDVEVAAPPRPPAPTQRPGPERTRGFARYARARRGLPRS